jgi:Na+-driven multidrug efflux pump
MTVSDFFKLPAKKISKGFAPFVIPVITTQMGRCSTCATIDHVVSSSLSTASMAANQILTSVYYGLVPVAESLSLAAQSFVPGVTERGDDDIASDGLRNSRQEQEKMASIVKEKAFAMNRLLRSFVKAAGLCGLLLAAIIGTLPLYSGVFTSDAAVKTIVTAVVPLFFITCLKHGLFCASEGILLGQKDLTFLGGQYAFYTAFVPFILLRLKQAALTGGRVSLVSVWQVFLGYDIFRTVLMMGRIAWLERKRTSIAPSK